MKKVFTLLLMATTVLFTFTGCDKIKGLAEKEVDIDDIDFETEEIEVFPAPDENPNAEYHPFLEKDTLSLDDFEGASELKKYDGNLLKSVSVESASITVYNKDGLGGNVKEFKALVSGLSPYTIDGEYTLGAKHDAGMKAFVEKLIFHLITSQKDVIELEISGQTNLPESAKVKCHISVKGIKVKVKVVS